MRSDDKAFGPSIVAQMLGVCVASYVGFGVTRKEFKGVVLGIYDATVKVLKENGIEPGYEARRDPQAVAIDAQDQLAKAFEMFRKGKPDIAANYVALAAERIETIAERVQP